MNGDEAGDYRATLSELKANNKNQINLLTILADDYSEFAPAIVESIDAHLHNVSREFKLPTMYLTDSIVKNIQEPYRKLFERIIVKMFVHCFKNGDERVRASLFKLRDTWKEIFARGKLYELDLKVNAEDPNWPIETPNGSLKGGKAAAAAAPPPAAARRDPPANQKVHVNPKFVDKKAGIVPPQAIKKEPLERAAASSSRTVTVGGDSLDVKVEVKPSLKKMTGSTTSRDPRGAKDPRGGAASAVVKEEKKVKEEPADEPMPAEPTPPHIMKKVIKTEAPETSSSSKRDDRRKRPSGEDRKDKKREEADRSSPPHKHPRRSPPRGSINQRGGHNIRPIVPSGVPMKPSTSLPPPLNSRPSAPPPSASSVATPTNVVGAHAFAMPPPSQPSPPLNKPPSLFSAPTFPPPVSMAPVSHSFVPGPIPGLLNPAFSTPSNPFGPNHHRGLPLPPPPTSVHSHQPPSLPFLTGPNPMAPPPRGPPPQMAERKSHVFKDDNRLEGIPANNRIFVDGKAYEVLYIKETAVIEKDGLPHRIYFQGIPRNVVIDGTPYHLGFGESREVVIDGDVHIIRFGAPSRELYMGDYPFKGAFGGAPIIATINGRRHEIRLAGPAPEVKIEPEPSYELSRFLIQARAEANQMMNPRPAPPPPAPVVAPPPVKAEREDVTDLLGKLRASGILSMLNTNKDGSRSAASPPPLPIASDIRGGADRSAAPHPSFEKQPFDMRLLKTRYDSVVASLLAKRSVCKHCGLRFESLSGPRYEKHLDWHVRKNLAASTTKETKSRQWYCSAQDWVNAKDTAEDEDSGEGVDPFAKLATIAMNARKEEEDAKKLTVISEEAGTNKDCAVCGETFVEFYDEDNDLWKLKDCVRMGTQLCHELCAPDLTHIEEPAAEAMKSEEEDAPSTSSTSMTRIPIDPRLAAKSSPMI